MKHHMTRRTFIQQATAAVAVAAASRIRAAETPKPNIVFLFSDDHAQQAISAYGSKINTTPNIDRIANEGVIFRNNVCCNSICAPSRAAILTGLHSHANGLRTNRDTFDGSQMTFPKLLQQSGYQTAMIGKWHLKSDPTGFDHWEVLPGQGYYYNPDFRTADGTVNYEGYVSDIITDLSLTWLKEQRDPSKPFMLMCQHKAPHRTWAPGPDHLTMYDGEEIPEPATLFDDYSHRASALADNKMTIARHMMNDYDLKLSGRGEPDENGRVRVNPERARMTPEQAEKWDTAYAPKNEAFANANLEGEDLVRWKYQRYVKDYLRCIASVDDSVGQILDYLDEAGLAENTLVIYSSDQGFYLGEHGLYDKRWMYEESLRMPLVMRWPGHVEAGTEVTAITQNIDFAETFLEVAGAESLPASHGQSLLPLMKGQEPENWRDAVYYHYYEGGGHGVDVHEGVWDGRYKLIHYYDRNEWELFDLKRDPLEMRSEYGNPNYAGRVVELSRQLDVLKSRFGVVRH